MKQVSYISLIIGLISMLGTILSPALVSAANLRVHQTIDTGVLPVFNNTGSQGGGLAYPNPSKINVVSVDLTDTSATINWATNDLTLARVTWGTTRDYAMGNIYGEQYEKQHSQLITALQPRTKYFYKLTAVNLGFIESTYEGEFMTLSSTSNNEPENVSQFFAKPQNDKIVLTWHNPTFTSFDQIKIVRSDKFFPLDPLNGNTVYEGKGESFEDGNITPGVIYYYTAFVRGANGKYSSGAISSAMLLWFSENDQGDSVSPIVDLQIPFKDNLQNIVRGFSDLIFANHRGQIIDSANVTVPVGENVKLIFPEEKVPLDSAFMTLSIKDSQHLTTDATYLFNHDSKTKEYYVVTPSFKKEQPYELVVTIFNSSKLIIEKINGNIKIVQAADNDSQMQLASDDVPWAEAHPIGLVISVIIIGAALLFGWRYYKIATQKI